MQIYINRNNQQLGPFTEAEIRAQLTSGAISLQDYVWWEGQVTWLPLGQTALAGGATPPVPPPPTPGAPVIHSVTTTTESTSPLAIWSLVCGCLTLLCGLFAAIPAIILGHLALGDIKKHPARPGRGLALAGLVIGYIMTVLSIAALAAYMSFLPAILKAVKEQQLNGQLVIPTPSTNTDESTTSPGAPDQTTNVPTTIPPPVNSPDQATNSAPTSINSATPAPVNAPDATTNSTPAPSTTNAPDATTNAAPMSQ